MRWGESTKIARQVMSFLASDVKSFCIQQLRLPVRLRQGQGNGQAGSQGRFLSGDESGVPEMDRR